MSEQEKKLIEFATSILKYLDGEEDWDGDDIGAMALERDLFSGPHEEAPKFRLVDWVWNYFTFDTHPYTRPELDAKDREQAENYARATFRKYGVGKVVVMVASLCLENVRLLKEVNEHRAARGIDPLPVYEV